MSTAPTRPTLNQRVEEERRRIVGDLHDVIGGALVGARLRAHAIASHAADEAVPREEVVRLATKLVENLTDVYTATRGLIGRLHRFVVDEIMQHIEQLEQRIARMDQYLLDGLQPWHVQLNLLQTIPGIDQTGAAMLLVEIGADMTEFGSAERLASWVGICPGNNESAGKRKSGRIRPRQCLGASAAVRVRSGCGPNALRLQGQVQGPGYVVALAHKIMRTIYAMLASGTHYQDRVVNYEALNVARNAPRWMKMLRKHGYIPTPATA